MDRKMALNMFGLLGSAPLAALAAFTLAPYLVVRYEALVHLPFVATAVSDAVARFCGIYVAVFASLAAFAAIFALCQQGAGFTVRWAVSAYEHGRSLSGKKAPPAY